MELLPADYALCALAVVLGVTGLFRGFSGTLAFLLAAVSAAIAGSLAWNLSPAWVEAAWMRAGCALVAALLAFGLVRLVVKRLVNGLLAQPSDALFGCLVGLAIAAAVLVGWAWSGLYLDYSNLARTVAEYVR